MIFLLLIVKKKSPLSSLFGFMSLIAQELKNAE